MNSSLGIEEDQELKELKERSSSSSPPPKEETAPFKSLSNGVIQLKIDKIDTNKKPHPVLKQKQVQLKSVKLSNSKRALLKKNVFESDKSVTNGKL
jgi:hypothetical protein